MYNKKGWFVYSVIVLINFLFSYSSVSFADKEKDNHRYKNGKPFNRINKAFKNTCRRAGIEDSTPHVMRHTFASHLTMSGVDAQTIMELGGWKSLDLVMRYSHLAPEHKQIAVDKLDNLLKYCLS